MKTLMQSKKWTLLRVTALLFFLAAIGIALIPISSLRIDNRFEIWFYDQDPAIASYDQGHAQFGNWDWMSVYVTPQEGIYSEPFLRAVSTITDGIKALPDVKKVISITNARGNRLDNDELAYQAILGPGPWTPADIAQLRSTLETNLIYRGGLVQPGSDASTLIMVQVNNRADDKEAYRVELVDDVDAILRGQSGGAVADYAIAGSPFLNAELNRSSRHDMLVFYPLVSLLVTVIAWVLFRNLRDVATVLLALTGTTAWSVGIMMTKFDLNMVTIMMPTVLVTVSVANVMHVIVNFHAKRRAHPDRQTWTLATSAVKELWVPALGTTATTAVGFLSLTQTGVLPVSLLGYYAAAGIMFAYVITIVLVPILLTLFWGDFAGGATPAQPRGAPAQIGRTAWSAFFQKTSFKRPYLILCVCAAVAVPILAQLPSLDADTNYVGMFHEDSLVKQYYDKVEHSGYATNSVTLVLHAPQGLEDERVFRALVRLEERIAALPKVRNLASPVKLIAEVDRALAEDKTQWRADFPGYGREAIAQLILTAEISGNDDLADMLSTDHRDFQLTVFTDYMSSREVSAFAAQLAALANDHLPKDVTVSVTGLPVLWANMAARLIDAQSAILLSVVVPLFFIMLAVIRSVPLVLIGLIVNLLPVGLILGLMAWFDIKIDMATILIGGITMGIAVDDTIHFLWQFRRELLHGKTLTDAVQATVDHTGVAILMTSLLLSAGFLVMVASDFYPTSNFGWLTSLTVLIALACELFLLPSLLVLLKPGREHLSLGYVPGFRRAQGKREVAAESGRSD
ncbi:MAG: MMPL family transporter [Pseudomonadota bacterium]